MGVLSEISGEKVSGDGGFAADGINNIFFRCMLSCAHILLALRISATWGSSVLSF